MNFILSHWPLWFISLAMIVAAVIDGWKLKVPNWLTFPLVLSGWTLGLLHSFGLFAGTAGTGDVWASLAGTALGFALLFPVHAVGGMGAGDVKMQMGFGAWIGAFYGFSDGLWIILCAFCLAVVIGGVLAAGHDRPSRQLPRELGQFRAPSSATYSPSRAQRPRKPHNGNRECTCCLTASRFA